MVILNFVTSNQGKVATASRHLKGLGYEITPCKANITEIQAKTVEEIVKNKALDAQKQVALPLIVHDSGVSIGDLGGFPGPYAKYVEETMGLQHLAKMLSSADDRSCSIIKALAYIDEKGELHIFSHEYKGKIADKPQESADSSQHWSQLYTVFIPDGHDKPLSLFTQKEITQWENSAGANSEFAQLRNWLKQYANR